ncbi:type I polyketide synthase [Moorena producens JHB]|uniref:Type I polyketide synthase n=1 Tax=Moorena producens (strain JHB) TaxID=1454205 RepID=A0A1D9G254_MOOP1|nr:type I polyketide synthase [Moorena producens]AOY81500.1 type I polyketide synthase [Moorena producens JHB]
MNSNQEQNYLKLIKVASDKIANLEAELKTLKSKNNSQAIAIIGMGCRFPGGGAGPQEFWDILHQGVDAIAEVPQDRWSIDDYYDPDPETPGKMYSRYGGFIEQIQEFDPHFFGISGRETISLDPQQRLLLEVTWEALELAGQNPQQLEQTKTGIFVGICSSDYSENLASRGLEAIDAYLGSGNAHSTASGRISYILGLTGPSLAVDTACSSSLVSVHLACSSLRNQECNLAIAGGVNCLVSPGTTITLSKAQMLSPEGRCKTFDASANGFVRGEGCGLVVLKRLSDALSDGDNILAVIRGTAINQDGRTSGLTVPNGPSQQTVIRQALENGGVDPAQVSYVEAHGTGTSLGDPIEIGALGAVFGRTHSVEQPLLVGSVKTNIGHLEGAAGIAGLIKIVLQLQHQQIAPHLHLSKPNPYINWSELPVQIPTQVTPWQRNDRPRFAGVSSFGFSGTNAHVVLAEAPTQVKSQNFQERPVHLLTLSAKTEKALEELVERYHNHLKTHHEQALADICYTANTGRAHFNHRLAIIASNQQELAEKLLGYKTGSEVVGLFSGSLPSSTTSPKVAFLFTGQGSQYIKMGVKLYNSAPVFRQALDQCDEILRSELEHPLLSVLYPETKTDEVHSSLLDQTAYTQPALFAIEYALAQLWQSWGIQPQIVMGHSVGEYVAATVAGVFSLEDGLKLTTTRGKLMQQLPSGGEMVSVMASESKISSLIAAYTDQVSLAAINGPEAVVISGTAQVIAQICSQLESDGVKTKRLQVSHAFHSPLMEPVLVDFEAAAKQLTYNKPQIPLISNVTGLRADKAISTASYWVNHLRQPVRFAQGMETLHQQGYEVFLEIGPKPVLLGMGRQCLPETEGIFLPSMRPAIDEWQQMLSSLGQLYVQGVKVDWSGFDQEYVHQKLLLPTYPFQRQRYWIETANKGHQTNSLVTPEEASNPIFNLPNQVAIEAVAQKLQETGKFSAEQIQLLPDIINVLAQEEQQQLAATVHSATVLNKNDQLLEQLKTVSDSERKNILLVYLQGEVAQLIGMTISQIDVEQPLTMMGVDSLMAAELRNVFQRQIEVDLPIEKLMEGLSITQMVSFLNEQLLLQQIIVPSNLPEDDLIEDMEEITL